MKAILARGSRLPTLEWVGKDKIVNHHLDVPFRVLECKYRFDKKGQCEQENGNENMVIHGDNLDALKALLPAFEGKIKCIYIDPPYNTGNERWIYNDNVNDPRIKRWLGKVVGKEGEDLSRHDKWLCMMYPRLKLLHKLLSPDGFIFVSIDAFEYSNLKCIMDEIFGVQNFRNSIAVRRGIKNVQAQFETVKALSLGHEYIYLYSKNPDATLPKLSAKLIKEKPGKWDTFWRGTDRPTMRYELFGQNPTEGQWRWEPDRAKRAVNNYNEYCSDFEDEQSMDDYYLNHLQSTNEKLDFVRLNDDGVVQYYVAPQSGRLLSDNWMDILLSGSYAGFDTEKNVALIERIISWITEGNDIILDSFAGSGTTAHAVINVNVSDGGKRRFVLIEMMDYADSVTSERIKRVMNELQNDKYIPSGFSYYELGASLLTEDKQINEGVSLDKIRQYVYYSETKQPMPKMDNIDNEYLLGKHNNTAFYFYYEKNAITVLDYNFLSTIKTRADSYVIYADVNHLSDVEMVESNITFRKIPRDITRL